MWGVQHVEYWMTSDGRTFPTEEEANKHQEFLEKQQEPTSYCSDCKSDFMKPDNRF